MGKNISHLKIGSETYDLRPYAVCTSSAGAEIKSVTIDGFSVYNGAEITILFENGNIFWDDFGLNVNGSGDIFVGINGDEYHGGKIFPPNTTHTFRYDGTRWEMISYNGLYPTINCTYNDLCNFVTEDMLIPGQTYQIVYNPTIYSDDVEYSGDFNPSYTSIRSQTAPCSLVLTAISSHQFDEKVNVVDVSTDIKKNTNATWDVWYSLSPTRNASWAGNRTIYVYDSYGEIYHFCDAVGVWFNNKRYYISSDNAGTDNIIYLEYGLSNYYGQSLYTFNGINMTLLSTVDEYYDEYYSFYGVITRLIDEYDNDLPYDFKNIYFKGYNLLSDTMFTTNKYYPTFTVTGSFIPFGLDASVSGHAHCNKIERCYRNGYAVLNQNMFIRNIYNNDYYDGYVCHNTFGYGCYKNLIKGSANGISFGNNCYENKLDSNCRDISFGNDCYNNKIGSDCFAISFGNSCRNNEIGNTSSGTSFGNGCYSNNIGNTSSYNSFGNYCYGNNIGNTVSYNSFGNGCYSNNIGNTSSYNSFGPGCRNNTFGTNTCYNTIGNSCSYISFGNYCYGNQIGNYCTYIGGGTYCFYNTYGNYCGFIYFKTSKSSTGTNRNYCYYNYVDSGVRYVVLYNTNSASSSYKLQNAHVYQGYSSSSYKYASISYNLTAKCIVRNSSDTSVTLQS